MDGDVPESADEADLIPTSRPSLDPSTTKNAQVKGKRARVDTCDDPETSRQPTAQPPTRQARAMTAHEYVVSTTTSRFLATAKARLANRKLNNETAAKPKTQLSVAAFLRQIPVERTDEDEPMLSEAEAAAAGSLMEAHTLTEAQWGAVTFAVFLKRLGLHEVITPSNGSCLHYACYAMKTAILDALEIPSTREALKEASFYCKQLALYIIAHFDELIGTDTYPLSEASYTFLGTSTVDDMTIPRIIEHLRKDAKQSCKKSCGAKYWGTELHIMALLHWCKEPVYVCSVLPPGTCLTWEMAVQRYSYDVEANTVRAEAVTVADTVRCMKIYHANKVLPLMMVLKVSWDAAGVRTSHFNGVRTAQTYYDEWSGTKRHAAAMQTRLRKVTDDIAQHRLGTQESVVVTPAWHSPEVDGSIYEPSADSGSSDSGKTATAPVGEAQARAELRLEPIGGQDVVDLTVSAVETHQEPAQGRSHPEPSDDDQYSVAASDREYGEPYNLPGTPATQLTSTEEEVLLERLEDPDPIAKGEPTYQIFMKATIANRTAYADWQRAVGRVDPVRLAQLAGHHTPRDACIALCEDVELVLPLLHNMPYALVLLATVEKTVIHQLGKAIECEGHLQMLRRLAEDKRMSDAGREFCRNWATAAQHLQPLALKRRESEKPASWQRLKHFTRKVTSLPMAPDTLDETVQANEWLPLLTLAAAVPKYLPAASRNAPLNRLCDEVIGWLTGKAHLKFAQAVGVALAGRQWIAITVLFGTNEDAPRADLPRRRNSGPPASIPPERMSRGPDRS